MLDADTDGAGAIRDGFYATHLRPSAAIREIRRWKKAKDIREAKRREERKKEKGD